MYATRIIDDARDCGMILKRRMLRGTLRSRRAIDRFLAGDSGPEFRVRAVADDMTDSSARLRPYEAAERDWYTPLLGWVSGGSFTAEQIDAARIANGGVLTLESYD